MIPEFLGTLRTMQAELRDAGGTAEAVALHPDDLALLQAPQVFYAHVLGLRFYTSPAVPPGRIYMGSAAEMKAITLPPPILAPPA